MIYFVDYLGDGIWGVSVESDDFEFGRKLMVSISPRRVISWIRNTRTDCVALVLGEPALEAMAHDFQEKSGGWERPDDMLYWIADKLSAITDAD